MLPPLFGWSASDVVAALNYIRKIKNAYRHGPRGAQGYVTSLYHRVIIFEDHLWSLQEYLESHNTRYFVPESSNDVQVISPILKDSIQVTLSACEEYFLNADFADERRHTSRFKQLKDAFRHVHGGHEWAIELGNRLNAHELQIQTFMVHSRAGFEDIRWQTFMTNFDRKFHQLTEELRQLRSRDPTPASHLSYNGSQTVSSEDQSEPTISPEDVIECLQDLEAQEVVYQAAVRRRGSQCPELQDWKDSLGATRDRMEQYLTRLGTSYLQGVNQSGHSGESGWVNVVRRPPENDQIPAGPSNYHEQTSAYPQQQSDDSEQHSADFEKWKAIDSAVDVSRGPRSSVSTGSSRPISGQSSLVTIIRPVTEFRTLCRVMLYFKRQGGYGSIDSESQCDVQLKSVGGMQKEIVFRCLESNSTRGMPSIDVTNRMPCATPLIADWGTPYEDGDVYAFELVSDVATKIPEDMTNVVCTFITNQSAHIEPIVAEFLEQAYRRTLVQCIMVNKIKCTKNGNKPKRGDLFPPENQNLSLWVNSPSNGEQLSICKNNYYLIHRNDDMHPTVGVELLLSKIEDWKWHRKDLRLTFHLKPEFHETCGWHQIHFFFAEYLHYRNKVLSPELDRFINRFTYMTRSDGSSWSVNR